MQEMNILGNKIAINLALSWIPILELWVLLPKEGLVIVIGLIG